MKFDTFCPLFPGFYNTVFQPSEGDEIHSYNQENGTDLGYDDFNWDYDEYYRRVAKAFTSRLETELSRFIRLKIKFQNVVSPREYNFSNDSINISVSVSLTGLIKLIRERKDQAEGYIVETYTSCSGFTSFHSNNINDWLKKEYILEKPEHRIGALLACICYCFLEIEESEIVHWVESDIGYIHSSPIEKITHNAIN